MINVKNVIFFIYYLKTMWYKSNESVDSTKQDIETNGNSPTAIMLIFCPIGGHNILIEVYVISLENIMIQQIE